MSETQLMRSGNAPLRVFREEYNARRSTASRLMDVVVEQCGRWGALQLGCRFYSSLAWLLPAVDRLGQLRKLDITTEDPRLQIPEIFSNATALREVILTDRELKIPSPSALSRDIRDECGHLAPPSPPFREKLRNRSSCTLTKLVLIQCFPSAELIALLRGLPALTYFFLGNFVNFTEPQTILFDAMASPDFCPNLSSFLMAFGAEATRFDFAWDPFFAMAISHIQPNRPPRLEFIRMVDMIMFDSPSSDSTEARIKRLRDAGLDIGFMSYREFQVLKGPEDFF
ncbi:hypothetical protein B0H19DRAFT_1062496 [Mycena capillaripes]|nr:hypothetical protein B0H19DRAFT_1062496 [Mycena capillaripes]